VASADDAPGEQRADEEGVAGRLRRLAHEPELALAQLILLLVVALSAVQIILRYVFNAPLEWPEELSGVLVIWLTFLGAITLVRRREHARVELLEFAGAERVRRILYPLWDVATVVFLVGVVIGAVSFIEQMTYERLPTLRIKLGYVISVVPLAAVVMIWLYARSAVAALLGLIRGGRP
jgi:TRAP-type C4-dicarboxylate transport system permease small subunit